MKKSFWLVPALFTLFACGDQSEQTQEAPKPSIHSMIFMDKTSSVDLSDQYVANKYTTLLGDIVNKNINKSGDRIDVYFIHENTAQARSLSLVSRTEMEDTQGMNATDLEAAKSSFDLGIQRERQIFLKQLQNVLMQTNTNSSNNETNISAAIPILSKNNVAGELLKAYFLSDMVESTTSGRDFHKNPPKTIEEASTWANEDLKKWNGNNLSGAEAYIILPFAPTSSSKENNPNTKAYWENVFTELGANFEEL